MDLLSLARVGDLSARLIEARIQEARQRLSASPKEVAKAFESVFISMLIKELRECTTESGLFPEDPGGVYGGLFDLYMGKYLADSGGLGLQEQLGLARYLAAREPSAGR